MAEQDAFKRPKKQTLAEPFINPVIGGENLSMVSGGEITSPFEISQEASGKEITSPFEISPKPSQWNESGSAVIRQATDTEKSQLVMPGFLGTLSLLIIYIFSLFCCCFCVCSRLWFIFY